MNYDIVIGLEIHSELKTSSKIFCGCKNEFGGEPNTRCCPVCLGMPGTLPALNKRVLEYAIKAGLAMNCRIAGFSKFDRKNYFYPDMPKAYQVTQHSLPICYDGYVDIDVGYETKRIGIERIHIEEDAGKLIHSSTGQGSLIDYNRSGVPLIEIVTKPDLNSPEEAKILLETIKTILEYTEVSDCKMQEGSLRADVNLSLRPIGSNTPGVRTEMKNLNSFRAVQRAAQAEAERQARVLDSGQKVYKETRRWDDHKGESLPMRDKEEVMDYRCFPEPDLPPVYVDEDFINEIQASIPELPGMRRERYINQYGIPKYDAGLITQNKVLADIFEKASEVCGNPKLVSNWIMTEIMKRMNEEGEGILHSYLNGDNFGQILLFLDKGDITHAAAIQVIDVLLETGEEPIVIVERLNLRVQRDESLVANTIKQVVNSNPQALDDYISGKKKAFGFFMGKIMAELKGRGDPSQVKEILTKELQRYL
ncbi:MAG TPA: Asp-tRNA(Asn)/Glu-tRNA(Gln) amidotransferase subunit GatB [Clostridiaceae bacterium]|jgi:aspartyl-tRNA(Asn)/glutamyl-tRNA(Gln) amidotransferase subunit B|nr:Asp-tRNA(Asn)/Glu-tRNA(Gln) amidotransferase subunit GatB [Clostridiaceae bacterium]